MNIKKNIIILSSIGSLYSIYNINNYNNNKKRIFINILQYI